MTNIPAPHHFAPAGCYDDATEARIDTLFAEIVANNSHIRAILAECSEKLSKCDMDGFSMIPGYDLSDITKAIEELMPQPTDKAMVDAAEEHATETALDGR